MSGVLGNQYSSSMPAKFNHFIMVTLVIGMYLNHVLRLFVRNAGMISPYCTIVYVRDMVIKAYLTRSTWEANFRDYNYVQHRWFDS